MAQGEEVVDASDFESPEPSTMLDKIKMVDEIEQLITTSTRKKNRKARGKLKNQASSSLVVTHEAMGTPPISNLK